MFNDQVGAGTTDFESTQRLDIRGTVPTQPFLRRMPVSFV
jgi:hypothetical protein